MPHPKGETPLLERSLSTLALGESGVVVRTPTQNERLAEIGLIKGEKVTLLQVAPLGDPIVLQVLDTPIILRRSDLAEVIVRT
ncbi:MAG TPA: FeoA family protein [Turneriella sp.]|nr:FeoA family protein [Turneriella sp.]